MARELAELGFGIVSSGGTAAFLEEQGIAVTTVESVTQAPEILGGRVKTLHPRIHAGILARRERDDDLRALDDQGIEPIDLVCVNLYPFSSAARRPDATEAEAIELIDVGGPSLLRAAAKNHAHVTVLSHPDQFEAVLDELREHGDTSAEMRHRLAAEAFAATAAYDAEIAAWFAGGDGHPERLTISFEKVADLAYGENPHQTAAYYREPAARTHLLSRVEQLGGRELSFNNLSDLEGARRVGDDFTEPAAVIVKHGGPCGVATAATLDEAWERALAADPISAFGCVAVLNRPVDAVLGKRIAEHFVEVLLAPSFDEGALAALRTKKQLRILADRERRADTPGERDYTRVLGGLLVQDRDADTEQRPTMEVVCGSLTDEQWEDAVFAWRVCRHVRSNAIVIARSAQTIGIGAGQMSRVDAVRIAVDKARELGHDLAGAVLASDAFFPFADGPQLALDAGVAVIVQPGGSRRDGEVVDAVRSAGAAMVFTGRRHFRH
ncbi:MAG TPA: bifunctional phosphoribosylaminoimidazolecarboxamide formyltransferase/IMP cyclohydrolase [Gaiellaceae bacterium]